MSLVDAPPARLGLGRKLVLVVTLAVLSAVALDSLFRVSLAARGQPWSPAAIADEAGGIVSAVTSSLPVHGRTIDATTLNEEQDAPDIVHPFLGYDQAAGIQIINEARAYCATPARKDEFFVMIVGGSVAGLFGNDLSFLHELQRSERLRGRRINVLSMGRGGYRQPQQLIALSYMLSIGIVPDAVVNLDGFNEVAIGTENAERGVFPAYPSFSHWASVVARNNMSNAALERIVEIRVVQERAREQGATLLSSWRRFSAVFGTLELKRLRQTQHAFGAAQEHYVRWMHEEAIAEQNMALFGPAFSREPERVMRMIVHEWFESSVSMNAMCRARGILYLHVLQPTLHDSGSKPLTHDEVRTGAAMSAWTSGTHAGYPLLRAAGKKLEQRNVVFLDASYVFEHVEDTLYYDNCHFNAKGSAILAERIAAALLAAMK